MNESTTSQQQKQKSKSLDLKQHNKPSKNELELIDEKIQKCLKKINELDRSKHSQWTKLFNNKISDYFTTNSNNNNNQQKQQINTDLLTQENAKIDKEIAKLKNKLKDYEKRREEIIQVARVDVDGLSIIYNQQDNSINTTSSINTSTTTTTSNTTTATNTSDNKSIENLSLPFLELQHQPSYQQQLSTSNTALNDSSNAKQSQIIANEQIDQQQQQQQLSNNISSLSTDLLVNNNEQYEQQTQSPRQFSQQQLIQTELILNHFDKEFYLLKETQYKLQCELDLIQKKLKDNQELLIRELKINTSSIGEPIKNIAINLLKSNDQKLDEFKDNLKTSFQSLEYKINRSYDLVKEDIDTIKQRIDLVEKTNKILPFDNLTSYSHGAYLNAATSGSTGTYTQLFTKLFDIILTLCAIILLITNNFINGCKYVLSSCPRFFYAFLLVFLFIYTYIKYDDYILNRLKDFLLFK